MFFMGVILKCMREIRQLVREYLLLRLLEKKKEEENGDLLTEPDEPHESEDSTEEVSVVANIAGVTTPLGTGPTYSAKKKRKKSPEIDTVSDDWYKN